MQSKLLFGLACAFITFAGATTSSAWNDAGHLTIARIAWDQLNHAQRSRVVSILQKHPHKDSILLKDRPDEVSEDEWIFLRAAIWSDHVRPSKSLSREQIAVHPIHRFHRSNWHYVNYPYLSGRSNANLPVKPLQGDGAHPTNIVEQLELSMKVLKDETTSDWGRDADITDAQNKAVRLCWLFHLTGDLHQPLHTTTLIDAEKFPTGQHSDLGGNLICIRSHIGAPPYKLHAFWDDRLGTDSHYPTIRAIAEGLSRDPRLSPKLLPELADHKSFLDWTAEGYRAAVTNVYREGHLQFALWDDYDQRRISADDVPILPQGVEAKCNTLARRRAVLAGYRLANLLTEIVGN